MATLQCSRCGGTRYDTSHRCEKGCGVMTASNEVESLRERLEKVEAERDELSRDWDSEHYHRLAVERDRDALAANVARLACPAVELADTVENQEEVPLHKWALKCARMVRLVRRAAEDAPTASLARHDAELLNRPFEGLPGCTDGGCVVKKPEGMHTNGGCQCIKHQTASTIVQRLARLRDQFRQQAVGGGDE